MRRMAAFVMLVIDRAMANSDRAAQDAAPAVSGGSMSTAPASGHTCQRGDPIGGRVDFNRLATITGAPRVDLTVGGATRAAGLTDTAGPRSNTSSLSFAYTVAAADSGTKGISVAANALAVTGGSIKAAADGTTVAEPARATVSPVSVHGGSDDVLEVNSVGLEGSPPRGGTWQLGDKIEPKVKYHRFIEYSGRPGESWPSAASPRGQAVGHGEGRLGGPTEFHFKYDVQANDLDADGISSAANAVRLNGGYIRAASDSSLDADLSRETIRAVVPLHGAGRRQRQRRHQQRGQCAEPERRHHGID